MNTINSICVYCGSKPGIQKVYKDTALQLGQELAKRNISLVYGGGNVGLMKAVADGCLDAGGRVVGVIPRRLKDLELAHPGVSTLYTTESMHERKYLMAQLSDAFIALPGGIGTLEEVSEALTWTQLNYHDKAVGLLNVAGYYDPLLSWLQHAQQEGFLRARHRELLHVDTDPPSLIDKLRQNDFPRLEDLL